MGASFHSVVVAMEMLDESLSLVHDVIQGCTMVISGVSLIPGERFALYGLQVVDLDPLMLAFTQDSKVTQVTRSEQFPSSMVELCAGTGAIGAAASFVGAKVLASMDVNFLAARRLAANKHGEVIQGDLNDLAFVQQLHHKVAGESFVISAGFPCQPYSQQGMMNQCNDPRAQTFRGLIKAILMLQPAAVMLECVPGAALDKEVQMGLKHLCEKMQWHGADAILELSHQWPTRRKRWWVLLAPTSWNLSSFGPWPSESNFDRVSKVLPSFGEFALAVEEELLLTPAELQAYSDPRFGDEDRLLKQHQVCPTMLHSYSSALTSCPCGCRDQAFSEWSLLRKGLRGIFVVSTLWNAPRFLHPKEAALLHTVPATMQLVGSPREDLCLIGQIAAPLPALWTYVHLLNSAAGVCGHCKLDPMEVITKFRHVILQQYRDSFPYAVPCTPLQVTITAMDGTDLVLLANGHPTVAELIKAEQISLTPLEQAQGHIDGQLVPYNQLLPSKARL